MLLGFILNHIFSDWIIITSTLETREQCVCILKELLLLIYLQLTTEKINQVKYSFNLFKNPMLIIFLYMFYYIK